MNGLEKIEMNTLLLCLKRIKMVVPKPLRIKIFYESEKTIIVTNKNIFHFENKSLTNKIEHSIEGAFKSTIFDCSKKEIAILSQSKNQILFVKKL